EVTLPFLEGTQPREYCAIHGGAPAYERLAITSGSLGLEDDDLLNSLSMPVLRTDLLPEVQAENPRNRTRTDRNRNQRRNPERENGVPEAEAPAGARPGASGTDGISESGISESGISADDFGLDMPSHNPLLD
ncbi:MAG: hypothetical protein LBD71_01480, partial [Treponema sp.]|nr:hypothetical protein [Treponema sp.]